MSADEDTELRDLIIDSLEKKGILSKIKAELRASVFLALEETENEKYKIPLSNNAIQTFQQSREGCLSLALVREFLEFFHLDYTLAVLDSETSPFKTVINKSELEKDLRLNSNAEVPLLTLLFQNQLSTKSHQAYHDTSQRIVDWNNENNLLQMNFKNPSNNTFLVNDTSTANAAHDPFFDDPVAESDKDPLMFRITGKVSGELNSQLTPADNVLHTGGLSSSLEKQNPQDGFVTVRSHLSDHTSDDDVLSGLLQKKRPDKTNGYRNGATVQATGSSLSSLKDLPSLNVGSAKVGSRSQWLEHFDNIMHAAAFNLVAQDDYEDDFQSSESTHSGKSGSKSQDKKKSNSHSKDNTDGSVEEDIEEDISIPADDLLNTSASLGDDFTSDRTISHLSGASGYDYMEKLS